MQVVFKGILKGNKLLVLHFVHTIMIRKWFDLLLEMDLELVFFLIEPSEDFIKAIVYEVELLC